MTEGKDLVRVPEDHLADVREHEQSTGALEQRFAHRGLEVLDLGADGLRGEVEFRARTREVSGAGHRPEVP